MKFYVVCYKETTTDNGKVDVNCGVCEEGYTKESDAIQKVSELAHEHFNEHLDELDEVLDKGGDDAMDDETICCESNDNGDWACFHYHDDTYEYFVRIVNT